MPELIRLQTPDFEFSVWANDISRRKEVYQSTMEHRSDAVVDTSPSLVNSGVSNKAVTHSQHTHVLKFSPDIELNHLQILGRDWDTQCTIKNTPPFEQTTEVTLDNSTADSNLEKQAKLTLPSPLFFENTQYQFEWVFLGEVSDARLTHRSHNVNEGFRFSPEVKTKRGLVPARLTGTINTGNDVGWLCLPLIFELEGKTYTQHISFEVLPTKMALHHDLPAMYQAIDQVYPLWRFSLVEKTEQDAAASQQRGHFPLMWLANFSALRQQFEQALKVICGVPHSRLQPKVTNMKAARLKGRLPHKLAQKIKQDVANGQCDKRYRVEKNRLSVDTPENQFIKMVVNKSKKQLAEFEAKLRKSNQELGRERLSDSFLNELECWQQPLQKVLNQSFLKDVGAYAGLTRESLVLQQKTGYSTVYRIWQELKFYLDVFGRQSSISMKSVAEIYEVWCFLCIKQILEHDLGFELTKNTPTKLAQNDFFEYQLKDGFAGAFHFKRTDGVTARLAHEPKFTKKGQSIRSYLVNQEPDIVLEVTLPRTSNNGEEKRFVWLFDAKYRIKTDRNRFDDNEEDISTTDYVPDDAINQMHRYRDALIRLSEAPSSSVTGRTLKKSRPVFGAFALYPGFFEQCTTQNPYTNAIEEVGIGAFSLLPSQAEYGNCGHYWLSKFLQTQIGTVSNTQSGQVVSYPRTSIADKLYLQEPARIPYGGMRQMLYPDLVMTVALGKYQQRFTNCFEQFIDGTLTHYHLPVATFKLKYQDHVIDEIRYLALIPDHKSDSKVSAVWPIRGVQYLPRREIDISITTKESDSDELYILFSLGQPVELKTPVIFQSNHNFRHSIKITTMQQLEQVTHLADAQRVYDEVMV